VPDTPWTAPDPLQDTPEPAPRGSGPNNAQHPEAVLWGALADAGPEGVSVGDLAALCGRTRRWVQYRLREHAEAGRVVQVERGYWRAALRTPDGDGL
jgi:DNA segregation ATPase FtsK/SpoIIIE, S-DNA-T family